MQFLQRVFGIDTIVKPLPPAMANNVSHKLDFFTRIFTQFLVSFDFFVQFMGSREDGNITISI